MEHIYNAYLILSTVLFLFLGLTWSKSNGFNLSLKVILFFLGFFGVFVVLNFNGFIVKV